MKKGLRPGGVEQVPADLLDRALALMKKGLRLLPRDELRPPHGPSACPDEEGIKTLGKGRSKRRLGGPSACPDEEGIKTWGR